jgi:predicted transcriptional regulator
MELMGATNLKLSDELKRRIQALVSGTDKSAHAFMVEAIARETERAELRRRFGGEAAHAEEEASRSGKAYDPAEVFAYLKAKAAGRKAPRPRAKVLRRSS